MQEASQSEIEKLPSRYGGYFTGRVLRRKEQQWGELRFGASSSLLTTTAEGRAFRRNHKLYVTIGGGTSRTVVTTEGARRYEGHDVVGHVSFIPAERENHGLYRGQILSCLSLEIPPSWVTKCLDGRDASTIEFLPVTNQFDPLIFNLMTALQDEAEVGGPAGRLFAETSAALLCLHLIRRYSNLRDTFKTVNLKKIAGGDFERTFEFIEEHLGKKLPLDKLAEVTDMSASSFVRGFRTVTKMSPHRYILQRRIRRARDLLRDSKYSVAEIAYDLGFSSQSHFSTVFRAFVGDSPARFRQRVSGKS
jgi:AraC family transcriptional regulator